jgi:hypothetical protein
MRQKHHIMPCHGDPRRGHALLAGAVLAASVLLGGTGQALAMTYSITERYASELEAVSEEKSLEAYTREAKAVTDETSVAAIENSKMLMENKDNAFSNSYSFTQLNAKEPGAVSDQLKLTAIDGGRDRIDFTFYNSVGQKSSITDIYLTGTGGLLVLPGKITDQSKDVSYSIGASPPNLPVGKAYDFYATVAADSNPPTVPNGVNAVGEYVTWSFTMASGISYESVIKAIDTGVLRFGLLVPGYSGGSSSFINSCGLGGCSQTPSVPLPASLWLMFGAIGGLAAFARRGKTLNTST